MSNADESRKGNTNSHCISTSGRFGRTKMTYIESISNDHDNDDNDNEQMPEQEKQHISNDQKNKKIKLTKEEIQYVEWSAKRKELLLHYLKANHDITLNETTFLNEKPIQYGISAQRMFRKFIYPKQKTLINIFKREDSNARDKACKRTASNIASLIEEHRKKLNECQNRQIKSNDDSNDEVKPVVLILDNLRSGYNVGAILRIAETSNCSKVCTCGITPSPGLLNNDTKLLQRTACGAENIVNIEYYNTTKDCISYYKQNGYYMYALEEGIQNIPSTPYCHLNISDTINYNGIALVIGAEMVGINKEVLTLCDECIEIPMLGLKTSLNVSTATSIVVFEIMRLLGRFDRFKKDVHHENDTLKRRETNEDNEEPKKQKCIDLEVN